MRPNESTTWLPMCRKARTAPFAGRRASAGLAVRDRVPQGIRSGYGLGRGEVVPNGIVLKEGET